MSALQVKLSHRLGDFSIEAEFAVADKGVTALFGHSGAGKSTIVDAIAGHLRPASGHIRLGERVLFDAHTATFVPPEKRRMGCVFQRPLLFPHLRVRDNCVFGARRLDKAPRPVDIARIVDMLDISALLDRYPRHLSGGEGQRVAIARALLCRPRLLLMDEPLSAVDEARKREVLPYLERLRDDAGVPIVYVSHGVNEVARLADNVVVLEAGRVVAAGDVGAVLSSPQSHLGDDAGAVIDATVLVHDDDDRLTRVAFDGGELVLPRLRADAGAKLNLFIHARDVMLSLHPLEGVSANNVLPAEVVALNDAAPARVDVRLRCGATEFIARLTQKSARRLQLTPGTGVFAVIKTVLLRR